MENRPQEEGAGGSRSVTLLHSDCSKHALILSSDYKQPSFHSPPKAGPFLSLNECFNLQTNILRSFQGLVNNVLQSWSPGTWRNHPDSSTSICVGSLLEHPSRKDCVLSSTHWPPSFPNPYWNLGKRSWSFLETEESTSWNYKWSLPRNIHNRNDGREEYRPGKDCMMRKAHSAIFQDNASQRVVCGWLPPATSQVRRKSKHSKASIVTEYSNCLLTLNEKASLCFVGLFISSFS